MDTVNLNLHLNGLHVDVRVDGGDYSSVTAGDVTNLVTYIQQLTDVLRKFESVDVSISRMTAGVTLDGILNDWDMSNSMVNGVNGLSADDLIIR